MAMVLGPARELMGLSRTPSTGSLSHSIGTALSRSGSTGSLTSALKRFSSGNLSGSNLLGATNATGEEARSEEELGHWKYMVIDPKGLRAHTDANYSKESKSDARFSEGTVVDVGRRRRTGWTTFLGIQGCSNHTWLFDVSPKDKKVRMIEVEVVSGDWMYEACAFERVPVLPHPAVASKKTFKAGSASLEVREVVSVTKKVRPVSGKGSFLKLSDGRGWVLDFADGRRVMQKWTSEADGGPLSEPSTSSSEVVGVNSASDLGASELGEWEYVVLDPKGMALRSDPTYDPKQKTERRVHEGEVVVVKERRAGDGITFLRLDCPQGWVFDRQPGKASRVRMMQTKVERGTWHYVVTAESGIALRTRCCFSEDTKCGKGPLKGSLLEVTQRVRVGDTTFLLMKDGGRWIFDSKSGRKVLSGPHTLKEAAIGTVASVAPREGAHLFTAPTNQKWAIGKMLLLFNAQVEVKRTFDVECVRWAFVSKPGASGMEGWLPMDKLSLDSVASSTPKNVPSASTSSATSGLRATGDTSAPSVFFKAGDDKPLTKQEAESLVSNSSSVNFHKPPTEASPAGSVNTAPLFHKAMAQAGFESSTSGTSASTPAFHKPMAKASEAPSGFSTFGSSSTVPDYRKPMAQASEASTIGSSTTTPVFHKPMTQPYESSAAGSSNGPPVFHKPMSQSPVKTPAPGEQNLAWGC